jgi:hypothetical protein
VIKSENAQPIYSGVAVAVQPRSGCGVTHLEDPEAGIINKKNDDWNQCSHKN